VPGEPKAPRTASGPATCSWHARAGARTAHALLEPAGPVDRQRRAARPCAHCSCCSALGRSSLRRARRAALRLAGLGTVAAVLSLSQGLEPHAAPQAAARTSVRSRRSAVSLAVLHSIPARRSVTTYTAGTRRPLPAANPKHPPERMRLSSRRLGGERGRTCSAVQRLFCKLPPALPLGDLVHDCDRRFHVRLVRPVQYKQRKRR